jgi:hypothetical protein
MTATFQFAVRVASMHVDKVIFHLAGGKHGDVVEAQGLENVFVEVFVEGHVGDALDHFTSPIDSDLHGERETLKQD